METKSRAEELGFEKCAYSELIEEGWSDERIHDFLFLGYDIQYDRYDGKSKEMADARIKCQTRLWRDRLAGKKDVFTDACLSCPVIGCLSSGRHSEWKEG